MLRFIRKFSGLYFVVFAGLASIVALGWALDTNQKIWMVYVAAAALLLCSVAFSFVQFQMRVRLEQQLEVLRNSVARLPLGELDALHRIVISSVASEHHRELAHRLRVVRRLITFQGKQESYPLRAVELKNVNGELFLAAKCTDGSTKWIEQDDEFALKENIGGVQQDIACLSINQKADSKGHLILRFTRSFNKETVESLAHMASKADWTASKLRDYVVYLAEELPEWEPSDINRALEIINEMTPVSSRKRAMSQP